jgi:hypothetical protein
MDTLMRRLFQMENHMSDETAADQGVKLIKVQNLEQGDVIRSLAFRFGYRHPNSGNRIMVDGKTTRRIETVRAYSEDERLEIAARLGVIPQTHEERDFGAYDESRGTALFVVTEISATKHIEYGPYNGLLGAKEETETWTFHYATAVRVNPDGTCGDEEIAIQASLEPIELVQVLRKVVSFVDENGRSWFTKGAPKTAGGELFYPWRRSW